MEQQREPATFTLGQAIDNLGDKFPDLQKLKNDQDITNYQFGNGPIKLPEFFTYEWKQEDGIRPESMQALVNEINRLAGTLPNGTTEKPELTL